MSKFKKSTRQHVFSNAELSAMPISQLRKHANDLDFWARLYASEAARMLSTYKRRKRAEAKKA